MKLPINYDDTPWFERKIAREQYVKEQDGKCQHCLELLTDQPSKEVMSKPINSKLFPPSMFKHPIHLHHNRSTGMTIGAVHARCNAYLWQYLGE